jgi:hypothetical protein
VFVVCCVGSGLCDGLIIRSGESYRVCVCVCVSNCVRYRNLKTRRSGPDLGYGATETKSGGAYQTSIDAFRLVTKKTDYF